MPRTRILAVEPDVVRGERLKQFVSQHLRADVVVVGSADAAIETMSRQVPDMILTSALLAPQDDARLASHLKEVDTSSLLPVLTVPPLVEGHDPEGRGRFLPFLQRTPRRTAYDPAAVGERIADALSESRRARRWPNRFERDHMNAARWRAWVDGMKGGERDARTAVSRHLTLVRSPDEGRRLRDYRWSAAELPWLSSVKTAWGLAVRVVNISGSGILLESPMKLDAGSTTEFHLAGPQTSIVVPARVVRSDVGEVDVRGVKYHVAAAFDRKLQLPEADSPARTDAPASPTSLAELLARVSAAIGRGAEPAIVRATFEQGLRALVPAREIGLRSAPVTPVDGAESIYFTIPDGSSSPSVLQVVLDADHDTGPEEFDRLKAAAAAAAIVLMYERGTSVIAPHVA